MNMSQISAIITKMHLLTRCIYKVEFLSEKRYNNIANNYIFILGSGCVLVKKTVIKT